MSEEKFLVIDNADHTAWLKARGYGIGGSDASAILGMNPYKSNIELFEEKTGRRLPEDISDRSYVKYGTQAEPLIRSLFTLDYPEYQVVYHENRILRNKTFPFMQAFSGWGTDRFGRTERNPGDQDYKYPSVYAEGKVERQDPGQLLHTGPSLLACDRLGFRGSSGTFKKRLGTRQKNNGQALLY